jgi:hypothetical protein
MDVEISMVYANGFGYSEHVKLITYTKFYQNAPKYDLRMHFAL